jgi:hypothetical protein
MARRTRVFFIAAAMAVTVARAEALELRRSTTDAWQEYLKGVQDRLQARLSGSEQFLWTDDEAERARRVHRGEVVVAPPTGCGSRSVPDGLIHDWIGAVFIPGAGIANLLDVVHDYDSYKAVYKPVVVDSRTIDAGGAGQQFSMLLHRHVVFINAALQGRYRAHDVRIDSHRGYSIIEATRLQEVESFGRPGEHLLPPDTGAGFIWRIYSIARYEERDGGVYLEIEAMALTRDVPNSLRWLVNPVVKHLSVNSLTTTLEQTRDAVHTQKAGEKRLAPKEEKGLN